MAIRTENTHQSLNPYTDFVAIRKRKHYLVDKEAYGIILIFIFACGAAAQSGSWPPRC